MLTVQCSTFWFDTRQCSRIHCDAVCFSALHVHIIIRMQRSADSAENLVKCITNALYLVMLMKLVCHANRGKQMDMPHGVHEAEMKQMLQYIGDCDLQI